jgi:hypothetical protein
MTSWHIRPTGDPGRCSAEAGACPYGAVHFGSSEAARKSFEEAASEPALREATFEERELWYEAIETVIAFNESRVELTIGSTVTPIADDLRSSQVVTGHSAEVAAYFTAWYREPWAVEEGLEPYGELTHEPVGALVGTHTANTVATEEGTYVVDFSFAELDPNAEWPYVGPEAEWRAAVDRASVLGPPAYIPPPPDPRSLTLPVAPPGIPNPLLERAVMENGDAQLDRSTVKFLSVDKVRVACVKYSLNASGEPSLHSIETRAEYRQQGYMKKLLQELSLAYGGKVVRSSGSMTADGYNYTRHLTVPREGEAHEIKWDFGLNGKESFSFVGDWVTGYAR